MKKFLYILATCLAGLITFTSNSPVVYAARVPGTEIGGEQSGDYVLRKADSPFFLTSQLKITAGHTLTIEPGVVIEADPTSTNAQISVEGGSLIMNGTPDERISVTNIQNVYVSGGTLDMSYADMHTELISLGLLSSSARVRNSTLSSAHGAAIYTVKGTVDIENSRIENSYTAGIYVAADFTNQSSLNISKSVIANNRLYGILNKDWSTVHAENNWWGSVDGPAATGTNMIVGSVLASPWLGSDPLNVNAAPACCSSILFIPGLEGTRLYHPELQPFGPPVNNRLWEPNWELDVTKLNLGEKGESLDSTVFSGGPITAALGVKDVYGKFMSFLDRFVSQGTVNEWRAFGYDWRKPIPEVVAGPEKKESGSENLIDVVEQMASTSKTGKVTLIAHSNGGLVAKYLVKMLTDMGKSALVDMLISVAVPYIGTPEAIPALLHGDHQSLFYGLIESESAARRLGSNMASAYSLLPSAQFFASLVSPTIAFASSTVEGLNDGSYSEKITSSSDQNAFITDTHSIRSLQSSTDTATPIRGNTFLMSAAEVLHGILDPMVWPQNIARFAILGWNKDTTKSVKYNSIQTCLAQFLGLQCPYEIFHELVTTYLGDGTVVVPSAAYNAGTPIAVDLEIASEDDKTDISHATILEASSTQNAISTIITAPKFASSTPISERIATIRGVSQGLPYGGVEPLELRVSTHSPVELHVYDSAGNHTGPIPLPKEMTGNGGYFKAAFETAIPGSSYRTNDKSDGHDSYVTLRKPGTFSIQALGTDIGFVTLDVEKIRGAQVLQGVEYANVPVTPLSEARVSLDPQALQSDMSPLFGTQVASTSVLTVDLDGDGVTDISQQPNPGALPDAGSVASSTLKMVQALAGTDPHAHQLAQRIEHLIDLMQKGKLKQAAKQTKQFQFTFGHLKLKTISTADRKAILDQIDSFVSDIEAAQ